MRTIYECEVCRYQSTNKEDIERCEAQGKNNKFKIGEEVEFRSATEGLLRGKIDSYRFRQKTHELEYFIEITSGKSARVKITAKEVDIISLAT